MSVASGVACWGIVLGTPWDIVMDVHQSIGVSTPCVVFLNFLKVLI